MKKGNTMKSLFKEKQLLMLCSLVLHCTAKHAIIWFSVKRKKRYHTHTEAPQYSPNIFYTDLPKGFLLATPHTHYRVAMIINSDEHSK